MRKFFSNLKRKFALFLFLFLQVLQGFAQTWSVGGYNGFHSNLFSSIPLEVRSYGRPSLGAFSFVSRVGGIAFDRVATPAQGTNFSSLQLQYRSDDLDGSRLHVVLDDNDYTMTIPDWELLPIANYANSVPTACVTLFGQESTDDANHIQYHQAFINRLLGMRLLQADILFEDPTTFSQVFQYNGRYLLGTGESLPDQSSSSVAVEKVKNALRRFVAAGELFDSYVVTDAEVNIQFSTANGNLTLTGRPYYNFFTYGEGRTVVQSAELTRYFRQSYSTIRDMNPLVYDAVSRTMRYAAFFRYVRNNYSRAWASFLNSIAGIVPRPPVTTPTSKQR